MIRYIIATTIALAGCGSEVTCDAEPGEPDIPADCRIDEHDSCGLDVGPCEVAYVCKSDGECYVWHDEACEALCE
jgi:hypothetical protein